MSETSKAVEPNKPRERATTLLRIRRIGAVVLAAAALGVLFGLAPKDAVTSGDISFVMVGDELNQKSADSSPKQTVVNGWTARDLLELIAKQEVASNDQRPAALLTIAVLALCLGIATSAVPTRPDGTRATPLPTAAEPAELH
jgi:hypothetical protein